MGTNEFSTRMEEEEDLARCRWNFHVVPAGAAKNRRETIEKLDLDGIGVEEKKEKGNGPLIGVQPSKRRRLLGLNRLHNAQCQTLIDKKRKEKDERDIEGCAGGFGSAAIIITTER